MTNWAIGFVTSHLLNLEVLANTFPVKDVLALRHDGVFCLVVAESADMAFFGLGQDFGRLAS